MKKLMNYLLAGKNTPFGLNTMDDFATILESAREEDSQQYLTQNMDILVAAFGGGWMVNECIPKFRFGTEYISDFVIVTGQSFSCDIVLVELEPPTDNPFTKAGKYAKRLNDAMGQVNDWFAWIHDNQDYFHRSLAKEMDYSEAVDTGLADSPSRGRGLDFISAKIVIGRRKMLSDDDNKRRATILKQTNKTIEIVPYDRLLEMESKLRSKE